MRWKKRKVSLQGLRIHRSDEDRRARAGDADVDRAMEMLDVEVGAEKACISGRVCDVRHRLDALLNDLLPAATRSAFSERLVRWTGLTARSRAVDAAFVALFHENSPDLHCVSLCSKGGTLRSGEQVSPEEAMRWHIADALDDAYCVLLPHEAARRAFWAD